jgi:hypothetical protein
MWGLLLHIQKNVPFQLSMCHLTSQNVHRVHMIFASGTHSRELKPGNTAHLLLASTSVVTPQMSKHMDPTICIKNDWILSLGITKFLDFVHRPVF